MEQTIIVECSRQSSIEGTTGNYETLADFTCECGDGIVLDIGDKIQVHSGFISEKGAQAGEIEIKERDRGNIGSIEISSDIQYKTPFEFADNQPEISENELKIGQIYSHACEIGGNETIIDLNINDGETNIVYSPYKTANGEFYATLPRRHVGHNASIHTNKANPYEVFDCSDGPYVNNYNEGAGIMGNVIFNLDGGNPEYRETFSEAWQFCPADYKFVNQNGRVLSGVSDYTRLKGMIKNDNSRYTIFRANKIFRSEAAAIAEDGDAYSLLGGADSITLDAPGTSGFQDAVDLRDPALLLEWSQVRNLVTLKSKDGFNKPQDVAVEITQQMNLRSEAFTKKLVENIHKVDTDKRYHEKEVVKMYQSPCLKPYNCATSLWDADHFNAFRQVQAPTPTDKAHVYMSMFQHIGIKRPELHIQGRATNPKGGFLKAATGDSRNTPRNSQCFNTGLEWTEPNLDKLNALFNVQAKYPELFTGITQTGQEDPLVHHEIKPGLHRFLHFNKQDDATTDAYNASGHRRHNPKNTLGYDLYGNNASEPGGQYHYDNTMSSYPVFFDYNEDTKNFGINDVGYCEDAHGGISDINDLAYGWARKMRVDATLSSSGVDKFYIGFQFTRTGNAVPQFLYNGLTHIALSSIPDNPGRRFGWDYHFSAYGNPCMILYNGLVNANNHAGSVGNFCYSLKENYRVVNNIEDNEGTNATATKDMGPFYHEIFLGADTPALGYDTNEDRFYFTNLHISERVSNPAEAGQVGSGEIKANTNADTACYKINKRMLGTSYCPNVAPYTDGLSITAAGNYPAQILMSNNMEPFIPYDATGGMFIEDIAVPETIWDENLLGVLGFTYDQFNNTDTTRQVTIRDRFNATNLKSLTTQAPIQVADMRSWTKNGFGNSIFSLTAPVTFAKKPTDAKTIYEPATIELPEDADSTKITAVDLPTKTARPYYAIRSDIIPQSEFIGGNQDLTKKTAGAVNRPVVAIVNKINGYGDFYSSEGQQVIFTNTQKRVITQIKTSIHDPDGSYAKVDKSSSVIYKIIKDRQIDLKPVATLLQSKKKSDQIIADAAASMLKDPADAKPNYNYTFSNQ